MSGQINIRQSLKKAYRKQRPTRAEIELLKHELMKVLDEANPKESEEYHKGLLRDFLKENTNNDYFINTKGRSDLVIHNGKNPKSSVGVIIETKRPTNKTEMVTTDNLNKKAMQELLLYFLRERVTEKNFDVKHLIATNLYEWFIFDAHEFEKIAEAAKLKKHFKDFEEGRLSFDKTELFYKEIASPVLEQEKNKITFTHFDIRDYEKHLKKQTKTGDNKLIELQKILSPTHLLKLPFANDSNTLNKDFYNELLHIIGLEEYKEKSKKLIRRKTQGNRNEDSLIEAAITQIISLDMLPQIKDIERFGDNIDDQLFNVGLELVITWINRTLFLKLLESQIVGYHESKDYLFLNNVKVTEYDDLNTLFFEVLAVETKDRRETIKKKFPNVPYLNSSLFEPTELEKQAIFISNLPDDTSLPLYKKTVVKSDNKKMNALEYLLRFLDAYDFSSEGKEDIAEENKTLINASVLGLIYEKINGYKYGAFFTPGFVTMYMCRETIRRAVVQKFKEQTNFDSDDFGDLVNFTKRKYKESDLKKHNEIINSLKICDPAVGSGHFLVSALNEIIAIKAELEILTDENGKLLGNYEIKVDNDELMILDGNGDFFKYDPGNREAKRVQKTLFHEKERIIENCLFGVDINPNSVKICCLRLWIELLKNAYYNDDGELETFPNIDINIKCGNSLISFLLVNSDIRSVFDGDINLMRYKDSVSRYKYTHDRKIRSQMRSFIDSVKGKFQASPIYESAKLKELNKLLGEYSDLLNPQTLFDESEEEKKSRGKKLSIKKIRIDKLSTEVKKSEIEKSKQIALEWRFEFPELLDDDTSNFMGFDVIIGNPPYMKENDDKTVFDGLRDLEVYQGKMDIWYLFCGLGLDLLKENTHFCFIATNNWVTNYGAKKLRNKITSHSKILKLIDFNDFMVFDEASIQTMILMLKKDQNSDSYSFDYRKVINSKDGFTPVDMLCDRDKVNTTRISLITPRFNRNEMIDQFFTFSDKYISSVLSKINGNSNFSLSKDEILNGIHSHHDKVAKKMIEKETDNFVIGQGIFALTHKELKQLELTKEEKTDLIRPYYTSKQLFKYSADRKNEEWIIYTTSEFKKPETIEPYPHIKEHLDRFVKVITSDNRPYGLHRARKEAFFNGEKIMAIRKSPREPVFTYTDFDCYVSAAFYVIKTNKLNLKYLTALLNGKLVKFWLNHKGKKQGNNFQVDAEPLSQIPLMEVSEKEQKPFIELIDKILAAKKKDQQADTSELETKIDQMVYKLYGLTNEEIAIVEGEDKQ